jgi:aryl-alcohol dehydrogenase-like predicted oxidoreductase
MSNQFTVITVSTKADKIDSHHRKGTRTMKMRTLGNSSLEIAPLAIGGNVFGWTADETTSFKLLDAFVAAGFNLIDTADVYSRWAPGNKGGESETILGKWLRKSGNRARVVIATKVGMEMGEGEKGLAPAYIRKAVERSRQRLQVDTIDLYQAHQDDAVTPLEETLGAFAELVGQGKVRVLGASNYTSARLSEALQVSKEKKYPRYESLQPNFNLYDRAGFENELEPLCLKENVGVISYYSLAAGFLTGKYRSEADLTKSARGAKVRNYLNDRGLRIIKALDDVALRLKSTPARVALTWLMTRPSITAPIVSATSVEQWNDIVESTRLELDLEALDLLNRASQQ